MNTVTDRRRQNPSECSRASQRKNRNYQKEKIINIFHYHPIELILINTLLVRQIHRSPGHRPGKRIKRHPFPVGEPQYLPERPVRSRKLDLKFPYRKQSIFQLLSYHFSSFNRQINTPCSAFY